MRPAFRVVLAGLTVLAAGCDRFEQKGSEAWEVAPSDPRVRAREPVLAIMKAAEAATKSCVAGDLLWEEEATEEAGPKHYSRPCIPERCAPSPAEVEALRAAVRDLRKLVDESPAMQVPSTVGFASLAEAMLGFVDASAATTRADAGGTGAPPLSGLSMHYASLAAAYAKLYEAPTFPAEPPGLVRSLQVAQPGGDVCKGWGNPKYCDVQAVKLPALRKWRAVPACIEVESIKKPK